MGRRRLAGLKEGKPIRASVANMDPHACGIRRANHLNLAHPHIGFPTFSLVPLMALFASRSGSAHKRLQGHAAEHLATSRSYCQHGLHEKATPSFVADVSYPADLVSMGQIDVGSILHQQHHLLRIGLLSGLLHMRLHQCRKGDVRFIEQAVQRFALFPGLHVSGQGSLRVLRQRISRSSKKKRPLPRAHLF